MFDWKYYIAWMYTGVNTSIPTSGGPNCRAFLSDERKMIESVVFCMVSILQIYFSWQRIHLPKTIVNTGDNPGRNILLAALAFTFGTEVGFKLATRQFIWLLNPCHVITILQLYLLASPPSIAVTVVFRLHFYYLIGPIEALLMPVTVSRTHLFEKEIYYIQHVLLLLTPHYLLKRKGVYVPERMLDFSWALMAFGCVFLYHFTILQFLSNELQVNLNNMICPASADPFRGPWYRVAAVLHQSLLMFSVGKLYPALSTWLSAGSFFFFRRASEDRKGVNELVLHPIILQSGERAVREKQN